MEESIESGSLAEFIRDLKKKHEAIRKVLTDWDTEHGDCIIDDICLAVGISPTTVYYEEGK